MNAPEPGWLMPDWPAPPHVQALCTTRDGGVSAGCYESLNLGDHVGDAPADVATNRARVAQALEGARPVFLQQVHGTAVAMLDGAPPSPDGMAADAATATAAGVACTILVADCLPVLFTDRAGRRVAAAHAGWRGLAEGVLERTVTSFEAPPSELMAWLGPCIGPTAFEVGAEVKAAFEAHAPEAAACFAPAAAPGKWLADLPSLARQRLRAVGLVQLHGNDGSAEWCTVGNPSRFFSHRRDGVSGRFAALVWKR
jgi:hypothetical protein